MARKRQYWGGQWSHNVTADILVFQNNETVATLVFQTNPVGVGLFYHVKNFFFSHKFAWMLATRLNTLYTKKVKFERDLLATLPNFREVCMVGANLCPHHTNVWKISFRLLHFVTVLYILSIFLQRQSRNSWKFTFNINLTLLSFRFQCFIEWWCYKETLKYSTV